MRLLFLIPPRTSVFNRDFAYAHIVPSLAFASIIGNLPRGKHDILQIDASAENLSLSKTAAAAVDFKPDIIAISALTTQIHDAGLAAATIKKVGCRAAIITGGPHTSKIPEETLREFPSFDFVASGEGELLFRDFADAIESGRDPAEIPGIYANTEAGIVSGGPRPFIEDLDALAPPDWSRFKWKRYRAFLHPRDPSANEALISVTRGCPYNCIFCAKFFGGSIRYRSAGSVLEEIRRNTAEYGINRLFFTDETFTYDRPRAVELCEGMMNPGLAHSAPWTCVTRADTLDGELLALMKRAGCFAICIGVDSVDEATIRYIRKGSTPENILDTARLCRRHGILTEASYILGMPGETPQSIERTIRAAKNIDSDFATFSLLVPYPGTRIMQMAEHGEDGLVLLTKDWRHYGKQLGYALELKNLPRKALERFQRKAYSRFYFRKNKFRNALLLADARILFFYFAAHAMRLAGFRPVTK